jgi:SPP1 gp7 family putative phage head morphogenesis protein
MAILKQAPQEHVMPNGLKKQVQLNERRFKILMRDIRNDVTRLTQNSEDLDTWIEKLGGYTSQNVFVTGPAAEEATKIVSNIMNASKFSALPRGGTQELVKGVMSENTMHYVTKMGEDMKTELRKIAVQSYDQKLAPRDIAKEMATKIDGMTEARARTIARTETMRASNLANYAHAKQMGAQSFVVTSDPNRCPLCGEVYGDGTIVFSIDQNDMIPPYHPNCGCIPKYSMKSPEDLGALDTSEEVASAALAYHAEIQFDNFSKLWDQVVAETAAYA